MKINKIVFCFVFLFLPFTFAAKKNNVSIPNSKKVQGSSWGALPKVLPKKMKANNSKRISQKLAQVAPGQDFVVILKKPLKPRR